MLDFDISLSVGHLRHSDGQNDQKVPIPHPKQRSTTITNLTTQTEYSINVCAVNQHGVSRARSGRYFMDRVRDCDTDSIEMGPVSQHQSLVDLSQTRSTQDLSQDWIFTFLKVQVQVVIA